jgi:hypothetical protein
MGHWTSQHLTAATIAAAVILLLDRKPHSIKNWKTPDTNEPTAVAGRKWAKSRQGLENIL